MEPRGLLPSLLPRVFADRRHMDSPVTMGELAPSVNVSLASGVVF